MITLRTLFIILCASIGFTQHTCAMLTPLDPLCSEYQFNVADDAGASVAKEVKPATNSLLWNLIPKDLKRNIIITGSALGLTVGNILILTSPAPHSLKRNLLKLEGASVILYIMYRYFTDRYNYNAQFMNLEAKMAAHAQQTTQQIDGLEKTLVARITQAHTQLTTEMQTLKSNLEIAMQEGNTKLAQQLAEQSEEFLQKLADSEAAIGDRLDTIAQELRATIHKQADRLESTMHKQHIELGTQIDDQSRLLVEGREQSETQHNQTHLKLDRLLQHLAPQLKTAQDI